MNLQISQNSQINQSNTRGLTAGLAAVSAFPYLDN